MRKHLVTVALVLGIVVIMGFSLVLDSTRSAPGERFVGTDSAATQQIEADHPDYTPWFEPLFAPSSGEIESGLFALQAAIGGVVLGYCFGALRSRRRAESVAAPADSAP